MSQSHFIFPCNDLLLEGIAHLPEGSGPFAGVVVCHPHPLYGGDMDNNVVVAVCQALVQRSILGFRFNFRGVGRSSGRHAQGIGEQQDVEAALSFLKSLDKVDPERIGLCGYSFGTIAALPVAPSVPQVQAVAAISPFFPPPISDRLKSYHRPKLFIIGGDDLLAVPKDVENLVKAFPEPKQFEVIPGADHFWWGYEEELAQKVADFLTTSLNPPPGQDYKGK